MGDIVSFQGEKEKIDLSTSLAATINYTQSIIDGDFDMLKYHLINGSKGIREFVGELEEDEITQLGEFFKKLTPLLDRFGAEEGQSLIEAIFSNASNEEFHALAEGYEFQLHDNDAKKITAEEFLGGIEKIMKSGLRIHRGDKEEPRER